MKKVFRIEFKIIVTRVKTDGSMSLYYTARMPDKLLVLLRMSRH